MRILWQIHVYVSQEFLSLTENNQFRRSQPRQALEHKVCKIIEQLHQ